MLATATEDQLLQLREGDRLKYHSVQWTVQEFNTYADPQGYQTSEWLLRSGSGKQYYLMREVDPNNPETCINWYIAEELRQPTLLDPETQRDVLVTLWHQIQEHQPPPTQLRLFNRTYEFESETAGDYESDQGSDRRITWDYWDVAHLWNLALEAWPDGTLAVYSTRKVQPEDFAEIVKGCDWAPVSGANTSGLRQQEGRSLQLVFAWFFTILGVVLMMAGL